PPQHLAPPAPVSAQACCPPVTTAWIPLVRPDTSTGTVHLIPQVRPSPSWPTAFAPQHLTPPELVSAQVSAPFGPSLVAIAVTPLTSPDTSTGVSAAFMVPSPSWP